MSPPLFVVDTNILFHWAQAYGGVPAWADARRLQAIAASRAFCEEPRNTIFIPGVVWCELLGVFLHKDIDLHGYVLWHRNRRAALQRLEDAIFDQSEQAHFRLGEGEFDLDLVMSITRAAVPLHLLEQLRPPLPKLLDGMDAAILAEAWRLAEQQQDGRAVVLVSDDWGLREMARSLQS
ncbi:MAG: hypothetical protein FJ125_15460, partial [Deltaproteobacteria bacterium]|nr:hypothetical protein [Deltaproteobacteria bacterium]